MIFCYKKGDFLHSGHPVTFLHLNFLAVDYAFHTSTGWLDADSFVLDD